MTNDAPQPTPAPQPAPAPDDLPDADPPLVHPDDRDDAGAETARPATGPDPVP